MQAERFNPVTLITGAGGGVGAACAHALAVYAQGGLLLVDHDGAALDRLADELDAKSNAPERVSTLAFDVTDPDRWAQAANFIESQYGRLDWVVINVASAPVVESDLVQWGHVASPDIQGALLTLRAAMPLIRRNLQGGAIVINAPSEALKAKPGEGLLDLMRAAAEEGAHGNIRVNAIAPGGPDLAGWASTPQFADLVREHGGERAAFETISRTRTPLVRYAGGDAITKLLAQLLSDDTHLTGATLIVDGGYAL